MVSKQKFKLKKKEQQSVKVVRKEQCVPETDYLKEQAICKQKSQPPSPMYNGINIFADLILGSVQYNNVNLPPMTSADSQKTAKVAPSSEGYFHLFIMAPIQQRTFSKLVLQTPL